MNRLVKQLFVMSFLISGSAHVTARIVLKTYKPVGFMADASSTREYAEDSMARAGFNIVQEMTTLTEASSDGLIRKLSKTTGEGFWDITIRCIGLQKNELDPEKQELFAGSHRIVSYAPGEYVQPHWHNIKEVFTIRTGGCYVWMSSDNGENWIYTYCGVGLLIIPAGAWHCLIADENEGLCMDVWHDTGRSIDWCDKAFSKSWSPALEFDCSVNALRNATIVAQKRMLNDSYLQLWI